MPHVKSIRFTENDIPDYILPFCSVSYFEKTVIWSDKAMMEIDLMQQVSKGESSPN